MDNSKNIFQKDYFDNYFKRHISQWKSTKKEVLEFSRLDDKSKVISFIDRNRSIPRPDGTTKNISFLIAAKDSNLEDFSVKKLLILKLIKYADEFYEEENNMFYSAGTAVFLSIRELLSSLSDKKQVFEILNKALDEPRSYHILCALIVHYDREDIKIIDTNDVSMLKNKYLLELKKLSCDVFSQVKQVLDVLYRWKDWEGESYDAVKRYLELIEMTKNEAFFADFLINMRSKSVSSISGTSYWITYESLENFLDLKKESINEYRQNMLRNELIDQNVKDILSSIKFIPQKDFKQI